MVYLKKEGEFVYEMSYRYGGSFPISFSYTGDIGLYYVSGDDSWSRCSTTTTARPYLYLNGQIYGSEPTIFHAKYSKGKQTSHC